MFKESRRRSVLKTISWRFWATLTTAILVYIFTGKIELAAAIGGIEVVIKMILYFVHERAWNNVNYGKKQLKPAVIWFTGLSGSGKSTAIAAFEDAHFYCVDNMPVALLPKFLELPIENDFESAGLAFVMDLREKGFLTKYMPVLESLKKKGYEFEIIFLEADEEILLQRYNQTRRQHPFSQGKSLIDDLKVMILKTESFSHLYPLKE